MNCDANNYPNNMSMTMSNLSLSYNTCAEGEAVDAIAALQNGTGNSSLNVAIAEGVKNKDIEEKKTGDAVLVMFTLVMSVLLSVFLGWVLA